MLYCLLILSVCSKFKTSSVDRISPKNSYSLFPQIDPCSVDSNFFGVFKHYIHFSTGSSSDKMGLRKSRAESLAVNQANDETNRKNRW